MAIAGDAYVPALPLDGYGREFQALINPNGNSGQGRFDARIAQNPRSVSIGGTTYEVADGGVVLRPYRNYGSAHYRSGLTAVDKYATPGAPTLAATTKTSTFSNATYYVALAAGTAFGITPGGSTATQAITGTTQSIRVTPAASLTVNADYYDVFCSTASAPLWVGRVTGAQIAAGGAIITAIGTTAATGSAPAGSFDIAAPGSGTTAYNAAPYTAYNNAFQVSGVPSVATAGFSVAHLLLTVAMSDYRNGVPTQVNLLPLLYDDIAGAYMAQALLQVPLLAAAGEPLLQDLSVTVDGATSMLVLVDQLPAVTGNQTVGLTLDVETI